MQERTPLIKAIVFIVLTFIFAFLLFTGNLPYFSSKNNSENLITDKNTGFNGKKDNDFEKDIKVPLTNLDEVNKKSEEQEFAKNKKSLRGSWLLTEINSEGRTAKIDVTKEIPPEKRLIYQFEDKVINVYWGDTKTVLTYRWVKKDTIETIEAGADGDEKDHKEYATVSIKEDKLYMSAVDTNNNKSSGIFIKFKGELPKVSSKTKQ